MALAPSDICEALPAVTAALAAVGIEIRLERQQAFERRVGPVALVLGDRVLFLADDLAGLLVEDAARDLHRRQLFVEEALGLGPGRALLAGQRVFVLRLAADLVALGHDFGRVAHHHVDAGLVLLDPRVRLAAAAGDRGDALDAAADGHVDSFVDDLMRGQRDGLQARRAKAIDRGAGHASPASPARIAAMRATFVPCVPSGLAQPRKTSSISAGSSCGTFFSTSVMQCAARSSGRVRLNEPRKLLASGVRELATTTASLIDRSPKSRSRWRTNVVARLIEPSALACGGLETGRPRRACGRADCERLNGADRQKLGIRENALPPTVRSVECTPSAAALGRDWPRASRNFSAPRPDRAAGPRELRSLRASRHARTRLCYA